MFYDKSLQDYGLVTQPSTGVAKAPHELIIVPGHGSFRATVGLPLPLDFWDDRYWVLQSFQSGEPLCYIEHIRAGLELVDDDSLLVFSGGRTRPESGRKWSEAATLDEIAMTYDGYPVGQVVREEYARDSFQNVEFSLKLFRQRYRCSPRRIKVVGWKFKQERFGLHAETLGVALGDFEYKGVNNPTNLDEAVEGEARALAEFRTNPRGDAGVLLAKRINRDPCGDGNPWAKM